MSCSRKASSPEISPSAAASSNSVRPARERLAEALLLLGQHPLDLGARARQLGVRLAHLLDDDAREPGQERRLEPDPPGLQHGAPDHPAHHVAAALVRGRDAVGGEEGHPAPVVGEDPVRLRRPLALAVGDARLAGDPAHDLLVAVGVEDRVDLLQDPRGALEPEAGVDVLLRQRRQRAVGVQLELHEDEVPELEEAVALAARRALRPAAADLLAPVEEHLRVRPARPRAADRPEVVRAREPHDPLGRHAHRLPGPHRDLVLAEPELRVAREDGDPDPVEVELHVLEHELPGELDRAVLEVLAEREVAEHLEEGQRPLVQADVVDVGRPEDLLHGRQQRRRRLLEAEEERHQRLHPGRDQQRRAVVGARDQRGRGPELVALGLEELAEARAQLGGRSHAERF